MSVEQVRHQMEKYKPMARAAFAAGREGTEDSTSIGFALWWKKYVAQINERFKANEISYLGRDLNEIVPWIMAELSDRDALPTETKEHLVDFVKWAREHNILLDENKVERLGLE